MHIYIKHIDLHRYLYICTRALTFACNVWTVRRVGGSLSWWRRLAMLRLLEVPIREPPTRARDWPPQCKQAAGRHQSGSRQAGNKQASSKLAARVDVCLYTNRYEYAYVCIYIYVYICI